MLIPKEQLGNIETITTLAGDSVDIQYAVLEVTELVASNHLNGSINESFPQSLQPRNRTSSEAVNKLAQYSLNLSFSSLNKSKRSDIGAPIVGSDLVVESGNGRSIALKKAYYEGNAYSYRYDLTLLVEQFGIPKAVAESLHRPVLVRLRLTDTDRAKFARDSNIDNGQSQNEKLADNGRMFESSLSDEKSKGVVPVESLLKAQGRGLVASIDLAKDAADIKMSMMAYVGKRAYEAAGEPLSMYSYFVAENVRRYLSGSRQVSISVLHNIARPYHEIGLPPKGFELESDPTVSAAIGDALRLTAPMNYDVFYELLSAAESVRNNYPRQTIEDVLSGAAHPSIGVDLAEHLKPLDEETKGDKGLMAKILSLATGVEIFGVHLELLQNPKEYNDNIIDSNADLFPESVVSFIESVYADIPTAVDTAAVLDMFNHLSIADSDKLRTAVNDAPNDKEKLIADSVVWHRFGQLRNEKVDAYNASKASKAFKAKRLAEIVERDKHLKDINSPEHDEYFNAINNYRLLGEKPTAQVFSIEGLARLLAAENLAKNKQSKAAVDKVDNFIAAQIQKNSSLPAFVPSHSAKSLKSKITAYNNSDKAGVVESLPNILAYTDALNRLVGDNLPKNISLDFTGYRASFRDQGRTGNGVINVGSGSLPTMWHEFGHSLEYRFPAIRKLATDLLVKRFNSASEPKVLPIVDVLTDFGSKRTSELVINNYTFSVYAMRIYPSVSRLPSMISVKDLSTLDASEVISTALELLASPKGIAKLMSDKDHFSIAMAIVEYLKEKRN